MTRTFDVAIIGAGYVGLPLAQTFAEAGQRVLVVDVVPELVAALNAGHSHIEDVSDEQLAPLVSAGKITATADYEQLRQAAAILIALPTPLTKQRVPDLSYVEAATRGIAAVLEPGQLVVLESTTYPGTTREVVKLRSSSREAVSRPARTSTSLCRPSASTPAAPTGRRRRPRRWSED